MLNVTDEQKRAYNGNSIHKTLRLYFPNLNLTITNNKIYESSMKLKESLMEGNNIEFVGCISSQFSIQIYDVPQNLKGQRIEVYVKTDDTDEIPLFKGIVDSAKMQTNRKFKDITAYDVLYTKGQIDVAGWYNNLTFPITLGEFRNSLCSYIGLEQMETVLPNDDIVIEKKFVPKTLKCLTVLKSICQINGCFGIINRAGLFEYRFIYNAFDEVYPSVTLFPPFYPVADHSKDAGEISNNFSFYRNINYEEFVVKPVERLQIRDSEDDDGVFVGNPTGNKYIIQNNMFAYDMDKKTLEKMGERIFEKIANISFHPCSTSNNGLPFVEVGDVVEYNLGGINTRSMARSSGSGSYDVNQFNVMSREISGIQALKDNYVASGEEEQSEFVTDIQAQIDAIKRNGVNMDDYYTKEEIDLTLEDFIPYETAEFEFGQIADMKIKEMEEPTGWKAESVNSLPDMIEPITLYLIRGGIIIE